MKIRSAPGAHKPRQKLATHRYKPITISIIITSPGIVSIASAAEVKILTLRTLASRICMFLNRATNRARAPNRAQRHQLTGVKRLASATKPMHVKIDRQVGTTTINTKHVTLPAATDHLAQSRTNRPLDYTALLVVAITANMNGEGDHHEVRHEPSVAGTLNASRPCKPGDCVFLAGIRSIEM